MRITNTPFKRIDALISVVDHQPIKMGWIVFFNFEGIFMLINEVEITHHPTYRVMFRESFKNPWQAPQFVPFIERSELVTHKVQLFSWMAKLVRVQIPE